MLGAVRGSRKKRPQGEICVLEAFFNLFSLAESKLDKREHLLKLFSRPGSLQLTAAFVVKKGRD